LRETLDKLISLAKGEKRHLAPKDRIELFVKLSEILDRFRRLLIKFKKDFVSVSPIHYYLRLRQTL